MVRKKNDYKVNPVHQLLDDVFFFGFNPEPIPITYGDFEELLSETGGDHCWLKNQLMYKAATIIAHELLGYARGLDGKVEIPDIK